MNEEQKINVILSSVAVVIVLIGYLFLFSPLLKKNINMAQELKESSNELKRIKDMFSDQERVSRIKRRIASLGGTLKQRVPEKISVSQLNEILIIPANENTVLIESMSFEAPQVNTTSIFPFGVAVSYTSVSIDVTLSATRSDFVEYLKWIKRQTRYISIDKLVIASKDKQGSTTIKANLKLQAYSIPASDAAYVQIVPKIQIDEQYLNSINNFFAQEKVMIDKYKATVKPVSRTRRRPPRDENSFRAQNFILQGTVTRRLITPPVAIVSGAFLREGDEMRGYELIKIEGKRVLFKKNNNIYILKITE
ncbi:MAG: hypothetical protein NG737_05970 [Omnitrophica bacterium]|nr:hypothetical protein [Candidatus Omnitrophota bacterium]